MVSVLRTPYLLKLLKDKLTHIFIQLLIQYSPAMELLQAFILDGNEHNVHIVFDENDDPWFHSYDIANILGIKNIRSSTTSFESDLKCTKDVETIKGKQQVTFLSELGLYNLILSSRKPSARPFQRWVFNVIKQIRKNGRYELETDSAMKDEIIVALQNECFKIKQDQYRISHNTLVDAFANKNVVYLGIVDKCENGDFIIKIGASDDIRTRVGDHIKSFAKFHLIKVIEVEQNFAFEAFLHAHQDIKPYRYTDKINEKSYRELYRLTQEQKHKAINVATHNVFKFRSLSHINHNLELFRMYKDLEQQKQSEVPKESNIEILENYLDKTRIEPSEVDPILLLAHNRKHTQVKGDKIQAYYPDGRLYKTFISMIEVCRDPEIRGTNERIRSAIENRDLYKNYRWMTLDRSLEDDTIQEVPELRDSNRRSVSYEMVAALRFDKTKVMKVYANGLSASQELGVGKTCICNAITRKSRSNGFYWVKWSSVSDEMKQEYLANNSLPDQYIGTTSKPVYRHHPISNAILHKYSSIQDVIREFKISRQTLMNAINLNMIEHGYKWSYA